MKLIVNSKEDTYLTHKDTDEVVGYMCYTIMGEIIGYFSKKDNILPKANYHFVVNVNDITVELDRFHNLYKLDDGRYFIGYDV